METAPSYERLYDETAASVVSIYRETGRRGAGSGFVYDTDHVVTNEHVVRGRERVDVRYADAIWTSGLVVGSDRYTDLAVVEVPDRPADADPLRVAETAPRPGRPVAALGSPFGLDGSITTGVVSGVNRSMPTAGGFAVPDAVQTDAPIDPGNSGGPLVAATDGHPVIGLNRAKSGDAVGFAVSARVVATVVPTGDVIVGFAGHEVRSHEELTRLLLTDATPGESVSLTVVRDGRERELTVTPTERPVSREDRQRADSESTTIPVE